jgi:hypothetical protein
MKRTLRFIALAAVVALSSWVTYADATETMAKPQMCAALQDLGGKHQDAYSGELTAFLTCRQIYEQCVAACDPADTFCPQDCQCQFLNCRGYQCN